MAEHKDSSAEQPESVNPEQWDSVRLEREQRAAATRMRLLAKQPTISPFDPLFSNYCLNGTVKYGLLAGLLTTAHFFRKRDLVSAARRGIGTSLVIGSLYFGQCRVRTDLAQLREREQNIQIWLDDHPAFAKSLRLQESEEDDPQDGSGDDEASTDLSPGPEHADRNLA